MGIELTQKNVTEKVSELMQYNKIKDYNRFWSLKIEGFSSEEEKSCADKESEEKSTIDRFAKSEEKLKSKK